jgi:uncharacterized protein with PIN domain
MLTGMSIYRCPKCKGELMYHPARNVNCLNCNVTLIEITKGIVNKSIIANDEQPIKAKRGRKPKITSIAV